jgi:hypothetical protein
LNVPNNLGNNIGDLSHGVQVAGEETLVGVDLHVAVDSPISDVNSLEGFTTCNIELQYTTMNHPCNMKIDNLGLGQGGEQVKIQLNSQQRVWTKGNC